ncbi:MAG: choice-of-anchor D domain-containing protein [Bacteroidetes bacterium]|nr:choice-of-anchor D domain-containing protein [Bacteroidota bacterium]
MKKYLILTLLCAQSLILSAQNTMKIGSYNVTPNEEFTVSVEVNNATPFVAFQVDIPLSEELTYISGSAALNAARANGHLFSATLQKDGSLRLITYSIGNTPFVGNSGTLVTFKLKAGKEAGDYALVLTNAVLGNDQSENTLTEAQNGNVKLVAPRISLSAESLNFNRVALQSSANQSVTITNVGNSNLIINNLAFDNAQFSVTETLPITIPPQSNKSIAVKFAPTVKGTISKKLYITSNDPEQSSHEITLNAIAYAVNELREGSLNAASQSTQTLEFTINNMEAFSGFQFDIKLPAPMTYVAGSAKLFRHNGHTVSVSKIDEQNLRVLAFSISNAAFSAADGKVLSMDFFIEGNAGTYQLPLSNVMIVDNAAENILSASYAGTLQITAATLTAAATVNFGEVSILDSKEIDYRISNTGLQPLVIDRFLFSNPSFSTAQTLPLTIPAGAHTDVKLSFHKNAKSAETCSLEIFSNDPAKNPFIVALSASTYVPNVLKVQSQIIGSDEKTAEISVEIENEEPIVALQCELKFPAGLTPDIENITLSNRAPDHTVAAMQLNENTLRVLIYSISQTPFSGKSGVVFTIPFAIETPLALGEYAIELSEILLANTKSENVLWDFENGILEIDTPCAHVWGEWTVTKPATCEEEGEETRVCENNTRHTQKQPLAKLTEHAYGEWSDWVIITEATCEKAGSQKRARICTLNSEVIDSVTEVIPQLAHSWRWRINPNNLDEEIEYCSVCGKKSGKTRPITAVETLPATSLQVYPNPTTGQLTISGVETDNYPSLQSQTVEIYDNTGRLVGANLRVRPNNTINISHLPNGVYFVHVNGQRVKVIKN